MMLQRGPWRSMNYFNNFAPGFDDILLVSLITIVISLWASQGILWSKPPKGQHLFFVAPQLQEPIFKNIGRGPRQSITRQINDRMTELRKDVIIFWGSQSGKAERLANSFVRECITRFNLPAMAANLDLYDFEQLGQLTEGRLVGFILATYGEGNPTDNATGLYEYLCSLEKGRDKPLSRLKYFCFGLGNSKYQFYNSFVDYVDEALRACGAQPIAAAGKIDEAQHSDVAWVNWKADMMKRLSGRFGADESMGKRWPVFNMVNLDNGMSLLRHAAETSSTVNTIKPHFARVSRSLQLSGKNSVGSVRTYLHFELETRISNQTIKYETGDHIAIWPINPNDEVTLLASLFGWDKKTLDATIDIKPQDSGIYESVAIPVSTPTTRKALLQYQLDICGPVIPEILEVLASYSPNAAAKAYIDRCRLESEAESDMSSIHLTCGQFMKQAAGDAIWNEDAFSVLLSTMPKLRPRYFSIASSPLVDPYSIAITVGLLEKPIPQTGRTFVGLTTGYLQSVHKKKNQIKEHNRLQLPYNLDGPRSILSGHKLFAHVRKSHFKLPLNHESPIVMIAAGSGIAPFRGFVQERMALSKKGISVGKMILFYGSRSEEDCLYKDVWSEAEATKILATHFVFSAQLVDGKKFYVQQELLNHSKTMKEVVQGEDGSVYICGSTNMANSVKSSLGVVLGGGDNAIQQLRESRRLQEDVWA
ncbi:uncharacterized protein N7469_002443 [Penicillium citrinum]|uniref:NADPH--hemoprotein reductase n=1 Tax=Penicillium citrinum TaxID=5077 RepID=A0A9W9PDE2_PENCI|nr:uncharacterized protein N7469_002443 [Penicillium citrinum]KAJ5240852.1 hypothetical protein N7469_002443 [Penicillium citrinum]